MRVLCRFCVSCMRGYAMFIRQIYVFYMQSLCTFNAPLLTFYATLMQVLCNTYAIYAYFMHVLCMFYATL
jgi:hypothetical protein